MKKMLIIAEVYTIHSMNYICFLYILSRGHEMKCDENTFRMDVLQQTCSFPLHKMMDWSRAGYSMIVEMFYQLFGISFWRHPFTAEDPLVSKWCNATFLPKQLIYILDGRVSTF